MTCRLAPPHHQGDLIYRLQRWADTCDAWSVRYPHLGYDVTAEGFHDTAELLEWYQKTNRRLRLASGFILTENGNCGYCERVHGEECCYEKTT
jgi:hypothetical protein